MNNYLKKSNMVDFVIGAYAYINRELSPLIKCEIQHVLAQLGITVSEDKVEYVYGKYCTDSGISRLPVFSKRNAAVFGGDGMETLAKEIVSRCDLHDEKTGKRAMGFVKDFLGIRKAEQLLEDAQYSQDSLSDITWLSAINYRYNFTDFIKDVSNAQKFAFYDMSNDPYCKIREERRQQMETVVNDVSALKGLFLTKGKRKDIIETSAKLMQYSLNPRYDIAMDIKMLKREKEVLESYGL